MMTKLAIWWLGRNGYFILKSRHSSVKNVPLKINPGSLKVGDKITVRAQGVCQPARQQGCDPCNAGSNPASLISTSAIDNELRESLEGSCGMIQNKFRCTCPSIGFDLTCPVHGLPPGSHCTNPRKTRA